MNLKSNRCSQQDTLNGFETLEQRLMLTVNLLFDYSLDTQNFFGSENSDQRQTLEAAGQYLGSQLNDTLLALPTTFSDIGEWRGGISEHPGTGATGTNGAYKIPQAFDVPENTLVIFVGGQSLTGAIGEAGPGIIFQRDTIFTTGDAARYRGQNGAAGANPTDFAPWGGAASFDNDGSTDWYFDTTDPSAGLSIGELGFNEVDFFSVAIHEIGHILGVGTADSWFENITGSEFTGTASSTLYGGNVPLGGGGGHWAEGTTYAGADSAFDPILSSPRVLTNDLDRAGLTDIGWEVGPRNVLNLTGTSGNDNVRISLRPTTVAVTTNSVSDIYQLADFDSLNFDGLGGNDRLAIYGQAGDETAQLWSDRFRLTGSNYEFTAAGFETVVVNASGGTDIATFLDSAGNDRFVGRRDISQMAGSGFFNRVFGFAETTAIASDGNDVAVLYDRSTTTEQFESSDTYAQMTGDTFFYRANNFDRLVSYSTGGNDIAMLYDSAGDDLFVGRGDFSQMRGDNFFNRAVGFSEVQAFASGGYDQAFLVDTAGDDDFFGQDNFGVLQSSSVENNVLNFERVSIFGSNGGTNRIFGTTPNYTFKIFGDWQDLR